MYILLHKGNIPLLNKGKVGGEKLLRTQYVIKEISM